MKIFSNILRACFTVALGCCMAVAALAQTTTPTAQMNVFAAQAGATPSPARGQQFFANKHGQEWSCSSCHTMTPTGEGKHATTGKAIKPMAPAANPERFTDAAKTEKWFRRNCKDVLSRECTPAEKADFLAWLISLK